MPVFSGGPFDSIVHQGPLGATVGDVSALLDVISGTGWSHAAPIVEGPGLAGMRFSVWADSAATDPAILSGVYRTADLLVDMGAVKVPWGTDLSMAKNAFEVAFTHGVAQAVDALPVNASMDPVLKGLSDSGRALSALELAEGEAQRNQLRRNIGRLFENVDLVVSPVTECLPFEVEHEGAARVRTDGVP